jgi:transcriptional regulator with XRE-family HTH domain
VEDSNSNDFWKRTKALIKARNVKQETICEETGISLGTLRGWITHSRLPDAAQAVRIAKALQTSVEYLVTGEDTNPLAQENAALKEKIQKAKEALD